MDNLQSPGTNIHFYRSLPKIDLHRHLEGSLRFDTVRELARAQGLGLPPTTELRGLVQVQENDHYTFTNFLSKFSTLRMFYRSPEIIGRITREAISDAAADNVRYLELRFTPAALSKAQGFPLAQVMDWVIQSAHQAEVEFDIAVRLIASVNRHESLPLAAQVANLAVERRSEGIVGLDLAGDEAGCPAEPFARIFDYARSKGLHVTIHAGEWCGGDGVAEAIERLGAERVGHGIRVLESDRAIELAQANKTAFEVCMTSNYQSGVVQEILDHPMPHLLNHGLNVTFNTDDPGISQIDLSHEYRLACETFRLGISGLRERVLAAARSAFLPENQRNKLVGYFEKYFPMNELKDRCEIHLIHQK